MDKVVQVDFFWAIEPTIQKLQVDQGNGIDSCCFIQAS